eukprot:scpid95790/ scgid28959/ 
MPGGDNYSLISNCCTHVLPCMNVKVARHNVLAIQAGITIQVHMASTKLKSGTICGLSILQCSSTPLLHALFSQPAATLGSHHTQQKFQQPKVTGTVNFANN